MKFLLYFIVIFFSIFADSKVITCPIFEASDTGCQNINAHGGGIYYFNHEYYWVGESFPSKGEKGDKHFYSVSLYKSNDLSHWYDMGEVLKANYKSGDLQLGSTIERPKIVYDKNKEKYYIYFHLELKGEGYNSARVGVAVSDNVTGPYRFLSSFRLNKGFMPIGEDSLNSLKHPTFFKRDINSGHDSRDLNIFQDNDGKYYLVTSSENNTSIYISELNKDLTGLTGRYARLFPGMGNEAPILFKMNNLYYMVTSDVSGWKPNRARLFMSNSIFENWVFLGDFVKSNSLDVSNTFSSQGSYIFKYRNDFYFLADRWNTSDLKLSSYLVKKIYWDGNRPYIK
ncbi:glycoside hydrolase family 43 protein [Tatumella ptyseos]|uniref:glycoside hydrolase family 43 protein n=1 Tax=Tatumella ptyseos TaxID=82987 RepID=UPI0023F245EB|nr:glycoside hydrolase family 43 protein [Tatumella ptyseos]